MYVTHGRAFGDAEHATDLRVLELGHDLEHQARARGGAQLAQGLDELVIEVTLVARELARVVHEEFELAHPR